MSCIYVFKREPLKGKICGQNVSEKSITKNYCKQHRIIETKEVKEKKKKISDLMKERNTEIVNDDIRETERGYLCIDGTDYIINGSKSKVVIGKLSNGMFSRLEDKDVDFCKNRKWKYEKFI